MPSNDDDLENSFVSQDYVDVSTINQVYVTQCATDQFTLFEFKNKNVNNTDGFNIDWTGQTSIASSQSIVYLQIFNHTSGLWETIDSDNITNANVDFSLDGTITTNLSYYYGVGNWVSFRVYQEAKT